MEQCRAGRYEFEMESVIEGTFREYGAAMPGFSSIVASGKNTTILHYEPNNRMMEEGELLLLDIGAEYGYYTADISRTIPVNGEYSAEQRVIYQLVLDAQQAAIELMKPEQGWMEGQQAARRVIRDGLSNLGLITDTSASWQTEFYCIHGISHYVGLDVHDVGNTGMGRKLEAGMVITVEPGIYFREDGLNRVSELYGSEVDSSEIAAFIREVESTYQNYVNIGVRIEDDILVTREGNIILSRYAPREIEDIEMIMR
jgi:Xaa-Pro aminopeptidase